MTIGTDVNVHVWYDQDQESIKMRVNGRLTSVNNDPCSKRGNPSLFRKLGLALKEAGKNYPMDIEE